MKRALLILSMILMATALTAPFWVQWSTHFPRSPRRLVTGRVGGEFADSPWVGAVVYFGTQRSTLKADGKFRFAVLPGVHVLRVCCSARFEPIQRQVEVKNDDLYLELQVEPLLKIPGHLTIPEGMSSKYVVNVSARRVFTKVVRKAVVAVDGKFTLYLSKGEWRLDLEDSSQGLVLQSITVGGEEIPDRTLTILRTQDPPLPLEITAK